MNGLDLNRIAGPVVGLVHAPERLVLYRSVGQVVESGRTRPVYAPGQEMSGQVQSLGDEALYHSGNVGQNEIVRRIYLAASPETRPAGLIRPLCRGGDMLRRLLDSTWWLIDAVSEDFSTSGWTQVRACLQVKAPDFSASSWFES